MNNHEVLFAEKQKFNQWWVWLLLLGINAQLIFGVYKQVYQGMTFGDRPMSNEGLLFAAGLVFAITILFISANLQTRVKSDGIYVRFFPFHLSFKHYQWNSISKSFVREYSPITEYGGWGLRLGLFGKGRAFNVSGNKGLQLIFSDNKKLLIGTNKPDELTTALKQIEQLRN